MINKINWNKYIVKKEFISTHGIKLPFKYEFDLLNLKENKDDSLKIFNFIFHFDKIFNIIYINSINPSSLYSIAKFIYYPNYNKLDYFNINLKMDYIIYDDIITTFKTMREVINIVGYNPLFCICLKNRMKELNYIINIKIIEVSEFL